ncbi:MAG: hypothetical protein QOJ83_2569, partial [Frankiales bacterium]|nr:hypothetical protein [Frankiales bacterium]
MPVRPQLDVGPVAQPLDAGQQRAHVELFEA